MCFKMKIDDKFKEVKDFQQFRAKAGAGALVFKVEAWSRNTAQKVTYFPIRGAGYLNSFTMIIPKNLKHLIFLNFLF